MRDEKPYKYALVVEGRKVGPFDRRTIIGMRVKDMLQDHYVLIRDDSHQMTVAELLADRFEMADAPVRGVLGKAPAPQQAPASGIWPTFIVNFGGTALRPGAFSFSGIGEMRYQGDLVRLTGRRRTGLIAKTDERIKVPMSSIASVRYLGTAVEFWMKPESPLEEDQRRLPQVVILENDFAIQELKDLLKLGA
jgi:hypothetical protein